VVAWEAVSHLSLEYATWRLVCQCLTTWYAGMKMANISMNIVLRWILYILVR
jgi:hypothetical protein